MEGEMEENKAGQQDDTVAAATTSRSGATTSRSDATTARSARRMVSGFGAIRVYVETDEEEVEEEEEAAVAKDPISRKLEETLARGVDLSLPYE